MKVTQKIMQDTYEKLIDSHIERIKSMSSEGLTEKNDIMLLDTCLKYVILMSNMRTEK